MTPLAIAIAVAIAACCTLGFMWLCATAPEGWQNSDGFHFGRHPDDRDDAA